MVSCALTLALSKIGRHYLWKPNLFLRLWLSLVAFGLHPPLEHDRQCRTRAHHRCNSQTVLHFLGVTVGRADEITVGHTTRMCGNGHSPHLVRMNAKR